MFHRILTGAFCCMSLVPSVSFAEDAKVEEPAKEVKEAPIAKPERYISVYGIGSVTTPDADVDEAAASGGLGVGYTGPWTELSFSLTRGAASSVGSDLDNTAKPQVYGYTVLDPLSSKYSFSALIASHRWKIPTNDAISARWGFYLRVTASNVNWTYVEEEEVRSASATPLGIDFGISSQTRFSVVGNDDATITFRPGLSLRRISGDLASDGDLRASMLGTEQRMFLGPSAELNIGFGKLKLGVMMTYLVDSTKAGSANGLTDLRFIPVVSGVAPIDFAVEAKK